ncbi:MAG: hypothetical protein M1823_001326 [Watsoniomyces obsoletus]|nr:MAG: hypothetical protein M1823_001326 [Watsoniomyces obsoletus]
MASPASSQGSGETPPSLHAQRSTAITPILLGRKARPVEADSNQVPMPTASISMPPPTVRPALKARHSRSGSGDVGNSSPSTTPGSNAAEGVASSQTNTQGSLRSHMNPSPRSNRISSSSLYSVSSVVHGGPPSSSAASTGSMSIPQTPTGEFPSLVNSGLVTSLDSAAPATAATSHVSVTTSSGSSNNSHHLLTYPMTQNDLVMPPRPPASTNGSSNASRAPRETPRSRSRPGRRLSVDTNTSSQSLVSERSAPPIGIIGVCALDIKARSKPSRKILNLLINCGFEIVVFGDKLWKIGLIEKAIAYQRLRQPFCVNDLDMQKVLWDRRLCLRILDRINVPTPRRIEVNRDGGPRLASPELLEKTGIKLEGPEDGTGGGAPAPRLVEMLDDGETLKVDGQSLRKPFCEKPVSGDDHNIRIYFSKADGGGGRRLFRKIGNKSSEFDANLNIPRAVTDINSSYIYEEFLNTTNSEDIKAYTVGPCFCFAETRKSPVVDGLVRRNTHGKEIRYVTELNRDEATMARKISEAFGQRICGFDLLRVGGRNEVGGGSISKSYVIDVNGFSFVKDNQDYYNQCAKILREMFIQEKARRDGGVPPVPPAEENTSQANVPRKHSSHRSTLQSILHRSSSFSRITGHQRHGETSAATSANSLLMGSAAGSETQSEGSKSALMLTNHSATKPDHTLGPTKESRGIVPPAPKHSWKLKGMVAVIRHADRTPKQKFKFTFHTKPFIDLLKGHEEEVLLMGESALNSVLDAVEMAMKEKVEDQTKLSLLKKSLLAKGSLPGTKVQIKPIFRRKKREEVSLEKLRSQAAVASSKNPDDGLSPDGSAAEPEKNLTLSRTSTGTGSTYEGTFSRIVAKENDLILDKLQLVVKWGGEPTHSARYQSQDLGENMRNELLLLNRHLLDDVAIFSSSERRVTTSARIFASAFLDQSDLPPGYIRIWKDLLDDSNAAKDEMDKVKKKLKTLLRDGDEAPPQFAWPKDNTPDPAAVLRTVIDLMRFHKQVMAENFGRLKGNAPSSKSGSHENDSSASSINSMTLSDIQPRWCCQEDAELFRERWEKLFAEFCDTEKVDPSKISELYDTMKFDALHNRPFLLWAFTPNSPEGETQADDEAIKDRTTGANDKNGRATPEKQGNGSASHLAHRLGIHRRSMADFEPVRQAHNELPESYFHFSNNDRTGTKMDLRLEKLRELYRLAKILFDYISPQEYGIDDGEKLKIGLLTSLPLLKEIVKNLEELQASAQAKSFIYFTKESHIYTLLNCILEGGIQTKIKRNAIPELDYLSQICFELYESENKTPANAPPDEPNTFDYSIRISISPGAHVLDPLDVTLDAKHCIGCVPRRSLTPHGDWKDVLETLRARFNTVKLPKRFRAVNLSEKVPQAFGGSGGGGIEPGKEMQESSLEK